MKFEIMRDGIKVEGEDIEAFDLTDAQRVFSEKYPFCSVSGQYSVQPAAAPKVDDVNQPSHYCSHPSGIECIQVVEHFPFNLGNAIKYIWRAGLKTPDPIKDLKKAAFYINREIQRLEKK